MSEEEAVIVKGENCARLSFRRSKGGLRVIVRGHPALEEMIRSWSNGEPQSTSAYGRYWKPTTPGAPALRAYAIPETLDVMESSGGRFSLLQVGQTLLLDDDTLNLSFIRLEGISSPEGVDFTVAGVFERKTILKIAEKARYAIRQFYMDFLLPVTVNVTMSTEEVRL